MIIDYFENMVMTKILEIHRKKILNSKKIRKGGAGYRNKSASKPFDRHVGDKLKELNR